MESRITSEPWQTWGTWCSRLTRRPLVSYSSRRTSRARLAQKPLVSFQASHVTPWRSRRTRVTWVSSEAWWTSISFLARDDCARKTRWSWESRHAGGSPRPGISHYPFPAGEAG